jgi:hypothetical protein
MRTNAGLEMRPPVTRIGRGGEIDRRAGAPFAAGGIGEIEVAERPRLRPVSPVDPPLEDQHVLVLVIQHEAVERPVEPVRGDI